MLVTGVDRLVTFHRFLAKLGYISSRQSGSFFALDAIEHSLVPPLALSNTGNGFESVVALVEPLQQPLPILLNQMVAGVRAIECPKSEECRLACLPEGLI